LDDVGRRVKVLADCRSLQGDRALISAIAEAVAVEHFQPRAVVINESDDDTRLAFLLSGTVDVYVRGRRVADRRAPQHVGELAAIDPKAPRSATVVARTTVVVGWLDDRDLETLTRDHPGFWRGLACDLADRLRQRSELHSPPNGRPHVFVASSSERRTIAEAVAEVLRAGGAEVLPWYDGVFPPSGYNVPSLLVAAKKCDFAVICVGPEDLLRSRGEEHDVIRDNLVFEAGMFIGALGVERVFLVKPKGAVLRLPSDLAGLGLVEHDQQASAASITVSVQELLTRMVALGTRCDR
jgi:CRP/FNR family cyclic AMP-dependent transcriptional regulator